MKKLLFIFTTLIVFLSCSTDDNSDGTGNPKPPKDTDTFEHPNKLIPQVKDKNNNYKVDYYVSAKVLDKFKGSDDVWVAYDKTQNAAGRLGLKAYFYEGKFRVFDTFCPAHWEDVFYVKDTLLFPPITPFLNGVHHFNTETQESRNGVYCLKCILEYHPGTLELFYESDRKKYNYKLVEYKIELTEDKKFYHITNPKYKK